MLLSSTYKAKLTDLSPLPLKISEMSMLYFCGNNKYDYVGRRESIVLRLCLLIHNDRTFPYTA